MTETKRYTYRLKEDLFEKLTEMSKDTGISINSVISNILTEYFEYVEKNPSRNVWELIKQDKQ